MIEVKLHMGVEVQRVGKQIVYRQAPCLPGGEINSEGQEETKEGVCRCPANPEGCYVDGLGIILPRTTEKVVLK